jgi:multicomponent Na+:H+ antiporter subunit D
MSFSLNFPLFSVVASLICAVVSSVLSGTAARRLSLTLSLCICTGSAVLFAYMLPLGHIVTYLMGHYPHPWGNELRISILEPLYSMVFAAVLFLCLLGGEKHLAEDLEPGKRNLYYVMADLVQSALLVLVYTNDIFTGYVFIEICTLASCGLLMIRQWGRTTLASVRYMIFSLVGSGMFLLGVVLLYNVTGHLLMPSLNQRISSLWAARRYIVPITAAICLTTVGIAIKSGMFPFHFWMPDTYGFATPSSAGILSGLISKGYIFFLVKIIFDVFGTDVFYESGVHNVLFAFGAMGIVVGSISAMRENDIFRMTAYSSAAQIGYIYMGIGISPRLGILAAMYHVLTHAVSKPPLFLAAARLCDTAGGRKRFADLQGAAWSNRLAGLAFSYGAFSMIGLPLTMGFISKYLFAMSAFRANVKMVPTLIILAVSTVLNTLYFARTVLRIYSHPQAHPAPPLGVRAQRSYAAAALLFILLNLAAGVAASPLIDILERGLALF